MEVQRRIVFGFVLLVTIFSVVSQPARATTISLDNNAPSANTSAFWLQSQGVAQADLTFAPSFSTADQSVPSKFANVEKSLTVSLEDRVSWPLSSLQADFRFNNAPSSVAFTATAVPTFAKDLSNIPSIAALQTFWPVPDSSGRIPDYAAWGGAPNVNIPTNQYQFTFNNDSKLFSAATKIPDAFLAFDPTSSNSPYVSPYFSPYYSPYVGGGGGFNIFDDAPEPASLILTAAGLGALALAVARRKRRQIVTNL
jgi:hypothetical protein